MLSTDPLLHSSTNNWNVEDVLFGDDHFHDFIGSSIEESITAVNLVEEFANGFGNQGLIPELLLEPQPQTQPQPQLQPQPQPQLQPQPQPQPQLHPQPQPQPQPHPQPHPQPQPQPQPQLQVKFSTDDDFSMLEDVFLIPSRVSSSRMETKSYKKFVSLTLLEFKKTTVYSLFGVLSYSYTSPNTSGVFSSRCWLWSISD
jgi:hypothetical protein